MAHDPKIGLNLADPFHASILCKMGVRPVSHDVDYLLKGIEPEGKTILESPRHVNMTVRLIEQAGNAIFVPEQSCKRDRVVISLELDTRNFLLEQRGLTLRLRFELDENKQAIHKCELSLKSRLHGDAKRNKNGMICREEIETDFDINGDLESQLRDFIELVKKSGTEMKIDDIKISDLNVFTATPVLRTDYSVLVKHPNHDTAHLFHACADLITYSDAFGTPFNNSIEVEYESECKGLFGVLPGRFKQSPEMAQEYLLQGLNGFAGFFLNKIPDTIATSQSKIERAGSLQHAHTLEIFNQSSRSAIQTLSLIDFVKEYKKGSRFLNPFTVTAKNLKKAGAGIILPSNTQAITTGKFLTFESKLPDNILDLKAA